MAIEEKTYLLCNYSSSKVVVALRDSSIVIEGGNINCPTTYPFTAGELQLINNTSSGIKNGTLIPEESEKEFVYESILRIMDWRDIKTNKQIEDIILNPTPEDYQWIKNMKDSQYFNRIYGVFIGLKNTNAPLTASISNIISARYRELVSGKRESEIVVPDNVIPRANADSDKIKNLESEIEELKALLKSAISNNSNCSEEPVKVNQTTEDKPVTKTRGSKK